MIIQHNIPALNSYNKLANNNTNLAKNLEKLSSGYRINRAGDDAAGLAISEKMRAQIKGLETATKNAKDGVSLVQTAEGALEEVHSILNRLVELAGQSANGIYDDTTDREYLQLEVRELLDEIDRISHTDFNGIELLNGALGGWTNNSALTATTGASGATSMNVKGLTAAQTDLMGTLSFKVKTAGSQAAAELTMGSDGFGAAGQPGTLAAGTAKWVMTGTSGSGSGGSITYQLVINETLLTSDAQRETADALRGATVTVTHGAIGAVNDESTMTITTTGQTGGTLSGGNLTLQIGDKANQTMDIEISDMSSRGLLLNGLDIGTQDAANAAIDTIRTAIDAVNLQRDMLGAKQNRLEHTINNLTTTTENITDAEARIRDTDMAKEMMAYTKNSILVQSAQAMLAQANQLPSSVLNLLY